MYSIKDQILYSLMDLQRDFLNKITESNVSHVNDISTVNVKSLVNEISTQTDNVVNGNYVLVQGAKDILSNLAPCKIIYNGITYPSVEHAYQHCKAIEAGDEERAVRILNAEDGYVAKSEGFKVVTQLGWMKKKYELMEKLLNTKANQSEKFRNRLLDTKDSKLVHVVINGYWGIGCTRNKFSPMKPYKGQNKFGILLELTRNRLLLFADFDLTSETANVPVSPIINSTVSEENVNVTTTAENVSQDLNNDMRPVIHNSRNKGPNLKTEILLIGDSVTKFVNVNKFCGRKYVTKVPVSTFKDAISIAKEWNTIDAIKVSQIVVHAFRNK